MSYEEVENYENKSKLEIYKELYELKEELEIKDNALDIIRKELYDKGLSESEFYFKKDDFEMRLKRLVELVPLINTTFIPDEDEMKKFFEEIVPLLVDKDKGV